MGARLGQCSRTGTRADKPCTGRTDGILVTLATPDGFAGKLCARGLSPGWCLKHGVFEHQLAQWREEFCTPAAPASREASSSFRDLQRQHEQLQTELRRKEKALVEVAALFVL